MAFITIAGEQLIAQKQGASQVLQITHFVLANIAGLGAEPADRIEAMPAAGNIVDTQVVTHQGYVNANQVVYSLALDSTIGDYDFNWVGLKAAGGELVACAHIPTQLKRKTVGAVAGNNLTRNFLVAFSGITATTAIAVPASTWQIDFTTRLLQIDERERLSNFDNYGQSAFFGNGFKVSLQSGSTYAIAAGIGYVGGIRCEQLATVNINITGLPKSVWIDASLQGDINGVSAVFSFSATAATLTDYTDAQGFKHFVARIADIGAGGAVIDARPPRNWVEDHEAKIDPHPQYVREADQPTQLEAETGTETAVRAWSALRVKQAIQALVKAATETVAGIAKIATQAETNTGTDDARIVTPLKLKYGFAYLFATNGYVKFPDWFGGFILQWGSVAIPAATGITWTYPITFPTAVFTALLTKKTGGNSESVHISAGLPNAHLDNYPGNAVTNVYVLIFGH